MAERSDNSAWKMKYALWGVLLLAAAVVLFFVTSWPPDRAEERQLELSLDLGTYPDSVEVSGGVLRSSEGRGVSNEYFFDTSVHVFVAQAPGFEGIADRAPKALAVVTSSSGDTMLCSADRGYMWSEQTQNLTLLCDREVPFDELGNWTSVDVTLEQH